MKIGIHELLSLEERSLYSLANQTGITYPNLLKLANGKTTSIKFDNLEKLCDALDCTPNEILIYEKDDD